MGIARHLQRMRDELTAAARSLEPATLHRSEAERALSLATQVKNAAATVEALLGAHLAPAATEGAGASDAATWFARKTGTSKGRARDALAVGTQLNGSGEAAKAARAGELSPEKAALVAEAVKANPDAEQRLVDVARAGSLGELREASEAAKRAAERDQAAAHDAVRRRRKLTFWTSDGARKVFGESVPEDVATIEAAVQAKAKEIFDQARTEGRREPSAAYAVDALVAICEGYLAGTVAEKGKTMPWRGLVRVDLDTLMRGWVGDGEVCEITGVGPVPVETARRLLGDSVLDLLVTKGVAVGNVVNLKRGATAAQRAALLWTAPRCENRACGSLHTQIDHRTGWAITQQTLLDDLDKLCDHDHYLKTHHGWALVDGAGPRHFVPPDDPRHPRHRRAEPGGGGSPPGTDANTSPADDALFAVA